jgi:2-succinyl-6-hydroxy-2,4-cyclohexadiene-1-carboxylate synthase
VAVILLHGFTHTGSSWEPVIAAVGERYRPTAPDIRGHGTASDREPVTLEAVIDDVAALVQGRFRLVGYSMGGRIALHVALAMPDRVELLTLIGASPGIADPGERAARREADERFADEIEHMTIEEFAQRWVANPVLAGQPQWIGEDRLRNRPGGLARALRGLGTGALPSVWDRLGQLRMQVALVVGERDQKFRAIAEQMAPLIPRVQVIVVPGVGHAVHLEASEAVAEVIVSG